MPGREVDRVELAGRRGIGSVRAARVGHDGEPGERGEALTIYMLTGPKWTIDYPLGHTDGILDLTYHAKTRRLASAGYDMQVRVTDGVTKKLKHLLKAKEPAAARGKLGAKA